MFNVMARAAKKQTARQAQDGGVPPRYVGSVDAPSFERIGREDEMAPTWSHTTNEGAGFDSLVAAAADPIADPCAAPCADPYAAPTLHSQPQRQPPPQGHPNSREACYHRAAEFLWSRQEAGQLRPSETLRMHVMPCMPPADSPVPVTKLPTCQRRPH